jgi:hypothetical protein
VDSIVEESPLTRKFAQYFIAKEKEKTYRFKPDIDAETIARENGELASLWVRAKRYNGKGCLNAVDNVEQIIAPCFLGQKVSVLGSLVDLDRTLLMLELDLATKRCKISPDAKPEEKIQIMQRKANLGMNAVLSMSLALGRLIAARDGKELPDILRALEPIIDRDYLYALKPAPTQEKERLATTVA